MDLPLIVLDADGVLVNYHEGYAQAFEQAFGWRPKVKDPLGYHPRHYWDVPELSDVERAHFSEKGFTPDIWRNMPALPGAVQACQLLREAGYRLRCVSALNPKHEVARADNLRHLGCELDAVHAVGPSDVGNPKQLLVSKLKPVAFVDDLLPFLQGIPTPTWRALINGRPHHSPNFDEGLEQPDSRHDSLLEFAQFWAARNS